ncbi:hypothetical protein V8E36_008871 [Tilletia maclaganii]
MAHHYFTTRRQARSRNSSWTFVSIALAALLVLIRLDTQFGVHAAPAPPQPAGRLPDAEARAVQAAARVQASAVARGPSAAQITQAPSGLVLERKNDVDAILHWYRAQQENRARAALPDANAPTPIERDEPPSVPLSQLGPPSFPAQFASCPKCEDKYSSLSSCMEASSVFRNATSIFNSPLSYIAVIKCACTDTFQSVYPQCLDCFQHTNQCYYLGTDPQGTGAPDIISNIRNICGFGSGLLGGAATANGVNGTGIASQPSSVPTYTDVSPTDYRPGYNDQSTGPIFGGAARDLPRSAALLVSLGVAIALGLGTSMLFA